jgi:hypothetical protein
MRNVVLGICFHGRDPTTRACEKLEVKAICTYLHEHHR